MDGFYLPPGARLEPGDIFFGVPFPALRYPLEYFRPNIKKPKTADMFSPEDCPPKDGDTARGAFQLKTVMLLSHGCELDGVARDVQSGKTQFEKRYWLVAPILQLSNGTTQKMQERIRASQQYNKFYLPAAVGVLGNEEYYVELRKITPVNVPYIMSAEKNASLTKAATLALHSHLGVFFSGLVLYRQPIHCPTCSTAIDPTQFLIPSSDEEESD
jgi:hypothetical protein